MVGAGLSCALGLPNTAALVAEVLSAYETERTWRHGANLGEEMDTAFAFSYPDGKNKDFRPDAVDFFSTLKTYIETGGGFTGGLTDAPELYRKQVPRRVG
jgi:hypothetical protein